MPVWGGGGTLISIPSYPPAPASVEFTRIHLDAANQNPFTGEQQIQNWQHEYLEASVSLPLMMQSTAVPWVQFLAALKGRVNVFLFSDAFAAAFAESLTSDGLTPRVWRLKDNKPKWSIRKGSFYEITFECREAIGGGTGGTGDDGSTSSPPTSPPTPRPWSSSAAPFYQDLLLRVLTVDTDVTDHQVVYLNRRLATVYGWLKKPITQDLTVRLVLHIGVVTHTLATLTIPAATEIDTVIAWRAIGSPPDFTYLDVCPDKSTVSVDVVHGDGHIDGKGIAAFKLIYGAAEV